MIYPIYIPTYGRAHQKIGTAENLERMGISDYLLIVEESERDQYVDRYGAERCLTLPHRYKEEYDHCDTYGLTLPSGPGPARNFAHDHARAAGHKWAWTLDDNIRSFLRYIKGVRRGGVDTKAEWPNDGKQFFAEAESMITRWKNVAMGGLHNKSFIIPESAQRGMSINTRIYSSQLVRLACPIRFRGRWNEDTIQSLDILRAGWCTVLLNRWMMNKKPTQTMKGGNSDIFYHVGTGPKSRHLARVYPQYTKIVFRYNRVHHLVDYSSFKQRPLIPDPEFRKEYPSVDFTIHFGHLFDNGGKSKKWVTN